MNILIVTKSYHSKSGSTAIQIRRIINSLIAYGHHNVILITEGFTENIEYKNQLEIINIPLDQSGFQFIERIVDRTICNLICLKKNKFILGGTSIAKKLLKERNIDILLTFSTPFDSHIVGLEIKREFDNLKWVTMFTDMWPNGLLPAPYKRGKLLSKMEKNLLRNVVEKCDGFITQSQYTVDLIQKHFKTKARFTCIPHCLSEHINITNNQLKGYVVHSGSLQKERIKNDLIEAISELAVENKDFKGLIHIGAYASKLDKTIMKHNCNNIFLLNRIPESLALRIQSMFEIGIIIEAPMIHPNPFVPGKITDTVQLNKKIVAITPIRSFLTDFANQVEGIYCCHYDKKEIKKCITRALQSNESINAEAINYFHPSVISQHYTKVFTSLLS